VPVPRFLQEILGGQECRTSVQQGLQDGELLDRQVQRSPVAGRGPRGGVELDPGFAQDARFKDAGNTVIVGGRNRDPLARIAAEHSDIATIEKVRADFVPTA
jgi:hypothetical protein